MNFIAQTWPRKIRNVETRDLTDDSPFTIDGHDSPLPGIHDRTRFLFYDEHEEDYLTTQDFQGFLNSFQSIKAIITNHPQIFPYHNH